MKINADQSNRNESSLLRRCLLGIRVSPFREESIFDLQGGWKIFNAGKIDILSPEERKLNENFQIERSGERVLVRIFLKDEKIDRVKYYFLIKYTDEELAFLITRALLIKLADKYPLSINHTISKYGF
jgi:hypothetical protein